MDVCHGRQGRKINSYEGMQPCIQQQYIREDVYISSISPAGIH